MALVLTRKEGESIIVDGTLEIKVVQTKRGQCRVALFEISNKRHRFDRKEVWEANEARKKLSR